MLTGTILPIVYMDQAIFEYMVGVLEHLWHNFGDWIDEHGFALLTIFFFAWLANRYAGKFLSRVFHSTIRADLYPTKSDRIKRLETIDSITGAILKVGVFIVAAIMVISEVGVDTTPLVASAGVLGIALGFGAQSLIKDFTSGVFIIIDNQYRVGDIVRLGDISGRVEAITIRTTVLRALDGTLYHIPNGSITATANLTMSYGGIEEDIVFGGDVDISKLALVIDRTGKELAEDPAFASKIKEPIHFERVVGFDINGIKVKVLGTTTPNESWDIRGEFYRRLIIDLRKAKIELPVTQINIQQTNKSSKKVKS
jgi:moderate conductance mechanosensitive channel